MLQGFDKKQTHTAETQTYLCSQLWLLIHASEWKLIKDQCFKSQMGSRAKSGQRALKGFPSVCGERFLTTTLVKSNEWDMMSWIRVLVKRWGWGSSTFCFQPALVQEVFVLGHMSHVTVVVVTFFSDVLQRWAKLEHQRVSLRPSYGCGLTHQQHKVHLGLMGTHRWVQQNDTFLHRYMLCAHRTWTLWVLMWKETAAADLISCHCVMWDIFHFTFGSGETKVSTCQSFNVRQMIAVPRYVSALIVALTCNQTQH